MRQNAFDGPAGELKRSSHPLAEIGGCLLLRGNWGMPNSKGGGKGRGKGKEGNGKGK